jgi:hypothetical protein
MLAENTDIDANTKWRDAADLLQKDPRYKNVENMREKEELFEDFLAELVKKERSDRKLQEYDAMRALDVELDELVAQGVLSRRSVWTNSSAALDPVFGKPEYKYLGEMLMRKLFQVTKSC